MASVASPYVVLHELSHAVPVIVVRQQLNCLPNSRVSCQRRVMVKPYQLSPQLLTVRNVDLALILEEILFDVPIDQVISQCCRSELLHMLQGFYNCRFKVLTLPDALQEGLVRYNRKVSSSTHQDMELFRAEYCSSQVVFTITVLIVWSPRHCVCMSVRDIRLVGDDKVKPG
ncbi:hypothetical protein DICSQDRAFT_69412 [Dichomitus squalens LYAD-421 SS1]|uniref:Uncharacterized protein n=1 Tax=Dichomitus squalens (strain LYAD-421) TaxID=732165 RepID=R7SNI6_DICSQ|nr:uncharacterized protein DICSQDRAFT_69412 [Dichomitus squalens LYAD-421 SS1]EJF57503.1 hypothetical protein DICSQDRAFT_69412 [Dichomitus squalens LYAD-421 SS1]